METKEEILTLKTESLQIISQEIINVIKNHETQSANDQEERMYHFLTLSY